MWHSTYHKNTKINVENTIISSYCSDSKLVHFNSLPVPARPHATKLLPPYCCQLLPLFPSSSKRGCESRRAGERKEHENMIQGSLRTTVQIVNIAKRMFYFSFCFSVFEMCFCLLSSHFLVHMLLPYLDSNACRFVTDFSNRVVLVSVCLV